MDAELVQRFINPFTGEAAKNEITLNMSQWLELRNQIQAAQLQALEVGMVIGFFIGVAVLIGYRAYQKRKVE